MSSFGTGAALPTDAAACQVAKKQKTTQTRIHPDGMHNPIYLSIKTVCWRSCNLVTSTPQARRFAQQAALASDIPAFAASAGSARTAAINKFVDENVTVCTKLLSNHRSNCNNKLREVCMEYLSDNKAKNLPSLIDLQAIVNREADADIDLFKWWWDKVLPCVTGVDDDWNHKVRYYTTIFNHKQNGQWVITPAIEVFALFMIMNAASRWEQMYAKRPSIGKRTFKFRNKKGKPETEKHKYHYVYLEDEPLYKTKYTKNDAGQVKFGGFEDGVLDDNYIKWVAEAKAIRVQYPSRCRNIEKKVLKELRLEQHIDSKSYAEHRKKCGKKAPKQPKVVAEVPGLFLDFNIPNNAPTAADDEAEDETDDLDFTGV